MMREILLMLRLTVVLRILLTRRMRLDCSDLRANRAGNNAALQQRYN